MLKEEWRRNKKIYEGENSVKKILPVLVTTPGGVVHVHEYKDKNLELRLPMSIDPDGSFEERKERERFTRVLLNHRNLVSLTKVGEGEGRVKELALTKKCKGVVCFGFGIVKGKIDNFWGKC